ncbi:hypothetical protein JMM59_22585, partial [Rhodovulum sulfidophilum]|nr:hypothetical protein [Rhodovulum sulfidophilum]
MPEPHPDKRRRRTTNITQAIRDETGRRLACPQGKAPETTACGPRCPARGQNSAASLAAVRPGILTKPCLPGSVPDQQQEYRQFESGMETSRDSSPSAGTDMTGGQLEAFARSDLAAAVLMERIVRGAYDTRK